jgi:hypothetical protein
MAYGIAFIFAGVFIAVGSFIFAVFNIGRQAMRTFNSNTELSTSGHGGTFARHLGAMTGLVIGGLIAFIGIAMFYFGY